MGDRSNDAVAAVPPGPLATDWQSHKSVGRRDAPVSRPGIRALHPVTGHCLVRGSALGPAPHTERFLPDDHAIVGPMTGPTRTRSRTVVPPPPSKGIRGWWA